MEVYEDPDVEELNTQELMPMKISLEPVKVSKLTDRLTLVVNSYWERHQEEPFGDQIIATAQLQAGEEEPYKYKIVVTEQPKSLDTGFIPRDRVGYIVLVNLEGTKLQTNPTDLERAAIKERVVVFDGFEVYPVGMPFVGMPRLDQPLAIKCLSGKAKVQVIVYPR